MARNQVTVAALVTQAIDLLPVGSPVEYPAFLAMLDDNGLANAKAYMPDIRKSGRVTFAVIRDGDGKMIHNVTRVN